MNRCLDKSWQTCVIEMKLYFILIFVFAGKVMNEIYNLNLNKGKRIKLLSQLTEKEFAWEPSDLLKGYSIVARRITDDLTQFKNYGSVRIVTLNIDWDISAARFSFKANSIAMRNIGSCETKDVIINLKRASYPAVNPDNYSFPEAFIHPEMREQVHTVQLQSNGKKHHLDIERPKPGTWYAIAYIKWVDPKMEKVEQKGLSAECEYVLFTSLQVKTEENMEIIDCYTGLKIDYVDIPAYFKCKTSDSIVSINFNLTVTNIPTDGNIIMFSLQALNLPTSYDSIVTCVFDPKFNNKHTIAFSPKTEVWHYIFLTYISTNEGYKDCEAFSSRNDPVDRNYTAIDLMRDDKGRYFTFEFGLPTASITHTTSFIDITSKEIKTTRFNVHHGVDIGGNLMIRTALLLNGSRELKKLYKIVVCMNIGFTSIPLESGLCKFNTEIKPALCQLYNTDHVNNYANKVVIPFPESGTWYFTFRMFHNWHAQSSYKARRYNKLLRFKGDEKISIELSGFPEEKHQNEKVTVMLSVKSMLCVHENCSDNGYCKLQTRDTLMSFCECIKGYGGWDCTDVSKMDSKVVLVSSILLLTLSNLFFLLTIYVAVIRRYFIEAVMYTLAMFFSTFYHSCDAAPAIVKKCFINIYLLQFGDFFCAIMCFWVTLLAMSIISQVIRTTLQLCGAIIIVLLMIIDRYSLVTFIFPFISGTVILFLSWFWDHAQIHAFRYRKQYYKVHFPIGMVLVLIGLICFAFLQTEENYKIVHSIWHCLIALSVTFFLPDVRREEDAHPFRPSPGFFDWLFCKRNPEVQ